MKKKLEAEKRLKRTPLYTCPHCYIRQDLGFDPTKEREKEKLMKFVCPFCGMANRTVWEHRYDATFEINSSGRAQYVIHSAIVSQIEVIASALSSAAFPSPLQ